MVRIEQAPVEFVQMQNYDIQKEKSNPARSLHLHDDSARAKEYLLRIRQVSFGIRMNCVAIVLRVALINQRIDSTSIRSVRSSKTRRDKDEFCAAVLQI